MKNFLPLILLSAAVISVAQASFVHPGLYNNAAELDALKDALKSDGDPLRKEGWDLLLKSPLASLSYKDTPLSIVHVSSSAANSEEDAFRNDALSVYAHALQWVVTGDSSHAKKAIQIMRDWSAVLKDVVPATSSDFQVQDELETAWASPMWLAGAEIILSYNNGAAHWSIQDQTQFAKMLGLFQTKADAWDGSKGCCPNQALSVVHTRLALAVFKDDKAKFDSALAFYRNDVLARAIGDNGEVLEINRSPGGDCEHASFNIEGLFDVAEIAWHQGVDLYADAHLPKGLEYMAELLTIGAQTSNEGKVTCGNDISSIETAYNHYKNRITTGPSLPHTEVLLKKIRPIGLGTGRFIPWDTFTHANLPKPTGTFRQDERPRSGAARFTWEQGNAHATVVRYALSRPGSVRLSIYSRDGKEVARVLDAMRTAGAHAETWNTDGLASGVYFARFQAEGAETAAKILINP